MSIAPSLSFLNRLRSCFLCALFNRSDWNSCSGRRAGPSVESNGVVKLNVDCYKTPMSATVVLFAMAKDKPLLQFFATTNGKNWKRSRNVNHKGWARRQKTIKKRWFFIHSSSTSVFCKVKSYISLAYKSIPSGDISDNLSRRAFLFIVSTSVL
jgi:hypothetical protein